MESFITDVGQDSVSVLALHQKIQKLESVLKKIKNRIELREKEFKKCLDTIKPSERKLIEKGLNLYKLQEENPIT